MASQEMELSVGIDKKNDQKAFLGVETHITGSGYKGNIASESDDGSLQDMQSLEESKNDGTLHALSGLYAQIVVVVAAILVFTEVLHGPVPLFFFQGYLFTFLIGGGIVCFICAYITMLTSKTTSRCTQRTSGERSHHASFSRRLVKTLLFSDISIYLRMGSVVFGIGTLISSGLEIASILTVPNDCMDQLNLLQPILRGLFSFLQMHFLFMSSKDMVNSFRWFRHTALMHLVATNLAVWIRIMLWESAKDWLDAMHYKHNSSIEWDRAIFNITTHTLESDSKHTDPERHKPYHRIHETTSKKCYWAENLEKDDAEGIIAFNLCLQNSTIGALWEKATPYLYPFTVQYCLVAAAVIYITWSNLHTHRNKLQRFAAVSVYGKEATSAEEINFGGSTRGLLLGLLILVVGIIGLILFFVFAQESDFNVLFLIASLEIGIFGLSALAAAIGLLQIRKMKSKTSRQRRLLELLQRIGMLAVYIYGFCNMIVGGVTITSLQNFLLFLHGTLMVIQACLQSLFIHQVSKKRLSPLNFDDKPGRQVVIFLVFINLVMWILESFTTQNQVRYQLQVKFFGLIAWPVITRIFLPLVILYRFHSAVALMEAWRKSYKVKQN